MPLYTVNVAVKYDVIHRVEADSKEQAEEIALDEAFVNSESGQIPHEGCPYVIETREPKEAK